MVYELICEDFKITDSIKTAVEESINHFEDSLPETANIHVFLSEPKQKHFKAIMKFKLEGKEIVASKEGYDLYKLIKEVRKTFENNLHQHQKRLLERKQGKES